MIFNKKITLYINGDSVPMEVVADLGADYAGDDWFVEEATGKFECFCNCGNANCANAKAEVAA